MDERTYANFYSYGSTAFRDEPKEFHDNRFQNFQNFLDANPNVVPLNEGGDGLDCQKHILLGGKWRCGIRGRKCPQFGDFRLWRHRHAMRYKGVSKTYFVATHPYYGAEDYLSTAVEDLSNDLLQGLIARVYHESKSWYSPNQTSLLLIGRPDVLDLLSTECLGEPVLIINGAYEVDNL